MADAEKYLDEKEQHDSGAVDIEQKKHVAAEYSRENDPHQTIVMSIHPVSACRENHNQADQ